MIRPLIAALALMAAPCGAAMAQDSRLQTLSTIDASRGWQAVGRLDIGGRSFCTATLIAPDRVLTAAHCLYDRASGARIEDARITFLAGWRTGRAEAIRGIRRSVVEPEFRFAAGDTLARVATDLAVLQLDMPIRMPSIQPFAIARGVPVSGDSVAVVSYARERAEAPSLQDRCAVLDQRHDGVMVLSCAIDFGASGAPVFAFENGEARIVSVISAMAETAAQTVALGMRIEGRIGALSAALEGSGARESARFLRP